MTTTINESLLYLWDQRTLYLGDLSGLSEVTQAAPSLMIGLEDDFEIWTPGHEERIRTRSALIPAGACASAENFDKPVAVCYFDHVPYTHLTLPTNREVEISVARETV